MKALLQIIVAAFALSACGRGGSDSDDDGVSLPGTALSPSEFAEAITSGLYRYVISIQADYESSFEDSGDTYTVTASGKAGTRGIISTIINSSTNATTDSCSLRGPVTTDPREFGIEGDEVDLSDCTLSYSQISDTEFGIAQVCPDVLVDIDIVSSGTLTRISDTPGFDNGTLSIANPAVNTVDPVTANSGVCGYISRLDTETTIDPPFGIVDGFDLNETDVTIVAPYQNGERIQLDITFANAELEPGDYDIDDLPTNGSAALIAQASLASPEFGGTASNPDFVFVDSGTITVDSVTANTISGSFTLTLDTAEPITGTFSIDLR